MGPQASAIWQLMPHAWRCAAAAALVAVGATQSWADDLPDVADGWSFSPPSSASPFDDAELKPIFRGQDPSPETLREFQRVLDIPLSVPSPQNPVTTVLLRPSTIQKSPAAVFTITNEMIQHSGAQTLPDVLRMVPGVHVGFNSAALPIVSIRGFGSTEKSVGIANSERVLVLIDGRDIYDPVTGGVYWPAHDMVLQDIDRIEVIRGPGASIWGANAVNGVINIITKSSAETQGDLVQGLGGTETRAVSVVRHGGQLSDRTTYRVFGKFKEVDQQLADNGAAVDDYRDYRGGFRIDSQLDSTDSFQLQGDIFHGRFGGITAPEALDFDAIPKAMGGNVLSRWTRTFDDDSKFTLMGIYDRYEGEPVPYQYARNTYILDGSYRWAVGDRQQLVAGVQYRIVDDMTVAKTGQPVSLGFDPADRTYDLVTWLLQDEIQLVPDDLTFVVGTKMEVNDFTGFEIQPTGRLLKTIDERRVAWSSISRAIRRPNRADENNLGTFPLPFGVIERARGNPQLKADSLVAYEAGFRETTNEWFSWDWTSFYNVYDNLRVITATGLTFEDGQLFANETLVNAMGGESYGTELTATAKMTDTWSVTGAYSFITLKLHALDVPQTPINPPSETSEGRSPRNMVYLRNTWSPNELWDVDAIFRYVDSLPADAVPSYAEMDMRLAWKPQPRLQFALVGQNLLDNAHPEYGGKTGLNKSRTEMQRGVYATATYQY